MSDGTVGWMCIVCKWVGWQQALYEIDEEYGRGTYSSYLVECDALDLGEHFAAVADALRLESGVA